MDRIVIDLGPRQIEWITRKQAARTCPECGRVFDLWDDTDAAEWYYGHDCETA